MEKKQELEKYINTILEKIVKPFYEKKFPHMYDSAIDIKVKFTDGVDKNEQKIQSNPSTNEIVYDVCDSIDTSHQFYKDKVSPSQLLQMDFGEIGEIERWVFDSLILIHECAHLYHQNNLWKDNETAFSFDRIRNQALTAKSMSKSFNILDGQLDIDISADLIKIVKDYGPPHDMGESIAKALEYSFIDYLVEKEKISLEEKKTLIEFEKKYANKSEFEYGYMYKLLKDVGEEKFCEYIKNIDIFKALTIPKKNQSGEYDSAYIEMFKKPEEFMKKVMKSGEPKSDKENVEFVLSNCFPYKYGFLPKNVDKNKSENKSLKSLPAKEFEKAKPFNNRSSEEIRIYNEIKLKNNQIKRSKSVKSLTLNNGNTTQTGSAGFSNKLLLILILLFTISIGISLGHLLIKFKM